MLNLVPKVVRTTPKIIIFPSIKYEISLFLSWKNKISETVTTIWGFQGVPKIQIPLQDQVFNWQQVYRKGLSSSVTSGQFPMVMYIRWCVVQFCLLNGFMWYLQFFRNWHTLYFHADLWFTFWSIETKPSNMIIMKIMTVLHTIGSDMCAWGTEKIQSVIIKSFPFNFKIIFNVQRYLL